MNLWADFENQHAPAESARHKFPRRLPEQVILSSLREWLLRDYTSSYCRSLAAMRIYRRCYWIDAWGIDLRVNHAASNLNGSLEKGRKGRDKSIPFEPLLQPIVTLSSTLAQESRPITLNGLVLAGGSSRRKVVRARDSGKVDAGERSAPVKEGGPALPRESGLVRASWLEIAPALLKEIEHAPAIFLLNPFGHTLFTYDDLAFLYARTSAPTELCLLVPHKQAEMHLLTASHQAQSASTLTALLRTDRWKALLPKGENAEGRVPDVDGMMNLLLASMQQYLPWVQRIVLPLQIRPAQVEAAPYTLLFATRSKDSLLSMNDALCGYRRRLYEQSRQGVLAEEWFAAQQQERFAGELAQLYQRILQFGRAQRARRWPDLRQQLLLANFGQFTLYEYDEVIGKLLTRGDVRCEWRRRPSDAPGDEEKRVPGNDDTLVWK